MQIRTENISTLNITTDDDGITTLEIGTMAVPADPDGTAAQAAMTYTVVVQQA